MLSLSVITSLPQTCAGETSSPMHHHRGHWRGTVIGGKQSSSVGSKLLQHTGLTEKYLQRIASSQLRLVGR